VRCHNKGWQQCQAGMTVSMMDSRQVKAQLIFCIGVGEHLAAADFVQGAHAL